ncbi:DUF6340 family protein [Bacteroidota bacterium]
MEILQPALITYPDSVLKIGYLNHSPLTKDAFSAINNFLMDRETLEIVDTIVTNNLLAGLWDAIKTSDLSYLDSISYMVSRRVDTLGKADMLAPSLRNTIFKHYQLDALVVMEYYFIKLASSDPFMHGEINGPVKEFALSADIMWRVYLKSSPDPIDEYRYHDTLYYLDTYMPDKKFTMKSSDVLRTGMYDIGYSYGMRHTTAWYEVARVIYRGGQKALIDAAELTDDGKWAEAAQIWFDFEDDINLRLAAKACNNLAVYYELQDDIEQALTYAEKAEKFWNSDIITSYVQELRIRKLNKEDIIKQYRYD